jgi:hypothetical protein
VSTCASLAETLDQEMLEAFRIPSIRIASPTTSNEELQQHFRKTGNEVSAEIGGRYLLRYLLADQVGTFTQGSDKMHYVTPTPYAPQDTVAHLFRVRLLE